MKVILFYFSLSIALLVSLAPATLAQESRQQRFERIETEKIAFITQQLELTPQEAQRFFPLYNNYRKELNVVLQSNRGSGNSRERSRMDELAAETAILAIKKKYRSQYSEIVGTARASRFFEVEREFREKLVKELRRREGRGML